MIQVLKDSMSRIFSSTLAARRAGYALCFLFIAYGLTISLMRVFLPVQLEIFEGKVLCQACDAALGNKIYGDPALYGAADIYTPVYPLILSMIYKVAEPSFVWGRLLSLVAACLTFLMLLCFFMKRRTSQSVFVGSLMTALFVSIAWQTDWFYSAFKSDVLCHSLWVAGLLLLLARKNIAIVSSAVLIALAFFVKQTAILALPGAVLFLLLERRRDMIVFLISLVVSWCAMFQLLNVVAGDWMGFYMFGRMKIQAGHLFPVANLMKYFFSLRLCPLTMALAGASVLWIKSLWNEKGYRLALLSFPFLLGGSCLMASSYGGGSNSMIPAYYGLVLLAGFSLERMLELWGQKSGALWFLLILLVFQFDGMAPYHISKARGKFDRDFVEIVDFLKQQEGTMYAPSQNVITELAGRHSCDDIILATYIAPVNSAGVERIKAKINSCQYDWLICDKHEKDIDLLNPETRMRYSEVKDVESWIVLKKKE